MPEAMIYDAVRTPRGKGKKDGALYEVKAVSLLKTVLAGLTARNAFDTACVDDVVMGCVTPVDDQGGCIPKIAALAAGWDWKASGVQINRFCASGLEAVNLAAQKVRSGWEDLVVAGGVESMSRVPMGSDGAPWYTDPETNIATSFVPQGIGADLIATLDGYGREDVDRFALDSHRKAAVARRDGRFERSLVAVRDINGLPVLDHDQLIREDATLDGLSALKPSFEGPGKLGFDAVAIQRYPHVERIRHVHTAGNSSGIVDGAAAVLIGNEEVGRSFGLSPRGRIVSTALTGTEPAIMLTGPAPATRKALAKAKLDVSDIDLFEVNEAFASVVLRFINEMKVPPEKVNVNGGAIAMGHPLGATGAMLIGTLLDELESRKLRYGLVTLCVGGGMGIATVIERV